ncbi:MAG TPA: hypothetical protein VHD81_05190 [Mycobacteriales bacterium]|nr:hypothetical protein [Mycobacteriales bacterium]
MASQEADESMMPRAILRTVPSNAPLVYDAWCRLGEGLRTRGISQDFDRARRDLWFELIEGARHLDREAESDIAELAAADPNFLLSLVIT